MRAWKKEGTKKIISKKKEEEGKTEGKIRFFFREKKRKQKRENGIKETFLSFFFLPCFFHLLNLPH